MIEDGGTDDVAVEMLFADRGVGRIDQQGIDDGISGHICVGQRESAITEENNRIRGGGRVARLIAGDIGQNFRRGKVFNMIGKGDDLQRDIADQFADSMEQGGLIAVGGAAGAGGEIDHRDELFGRV